jgi:hypothetical protein
MKQDKIAEEIIAIAELLMSALPASGKDISSKDRFTKQEWSTYNKKHPNADPNNFIIEEKKTTRDRGKEDPKTEAERRLAPKIKRLKDLRRKKQMPGQSLNLNELNELKGLYAELSKEFKLFGLSMDLLNV